MPRSGEVQRKGQGNTHKTFPFLLLSVQMELTCVWFFAVLDGVLGSLQYLVVCLVLCGTWWLNTGRCHESSESQVPRCIGLSKWCLFYFVVSKIPFGDIPILRTWNNQEAWIDLLIYFHLQKRTSFVPFPNSLRQRENDTPTKYYARWLDFM